MRFFGRRTVVLLVAVFTIVLLAGASVRGKFQYSYVDQAITTILSPLEAGLSYAGYGFRRATTIVREIFSVYQENQQLKAEIEVDRQNILDTTEIVAENDRLHALLDYKKRSTQFDLVTAAVVGRDPGSWTSTIVINKGASDGITKDMPVVTSQGLVGTVIQVFGSSSRVQLIVDPRSAVGGLDQRSDSRVAGIIEGSGTNHNQLRLVNLSRDADIVQEDQVITSGFGGLYPKGLVIGDVVDVANDEGGLLKYAVLKPAVDFDKLEEVMVIVRSREPIPVLPPPVKPGAAGQQTPDNAAAGNALGAGTAPKGAVSP